MKKKGKSITIQILFATLAAVVILAAGLVFVMTYFMNSLTDTLLLNMLQPTAKTAAQSIEGSLHVLADRFFLIRDNSIFTDQNATTEDKQAVLDHVKSGIEFVWLGIYNEDGSLLTGSDDSPRSIAGRDLYAMVRETANLAIEDTSVGNSGLEIVMGAPIMATRQTQGGAESYAAYYLVGSYQYDVINDVLKNINIGANGSAFIINKEGKLIAHKDLGRVFSQSSVADILGSGDEIQKELLLMEQGQTGSVDIAGSEGELFVSYAPIHGTRWSLAIQAPRNDFISSLRQAVVISVLITVALLILFTIVLNIIISKVLTSPLHVITADAHMLAQGQFKSRLPKKITERGDEIGELGTAFISMSDSIRGVIRDIGQLTSSARAGSLDERADLSRHQGDYHLIISGINATLDVFCSHLDVLPGALAMFDESRKLLYRNSTMDEILTRHGLDPNDPDLLALIVSSGASDQLNPEAASLFGAQGASGDSYTTDAVIPDRKGNEYNFSLRLRRIGGTVGVSADNVNMICVMLILNDVTMLTRAKMDAEAASHAKSDFLSNMSHEMRTPMNAIIGMTSIAKSTRDIERKDYCLGKIDDASVHLLGVINDVLDMSKIEANKFELSMTEFSFDKMLQKVVNVINFRVDEKQQDFSVRIDKDIPPKLISDDQRLAQVITNLLSNAVKFTPEYGAIHLNTHLLKKDDDSCEIQIDVSDTGIGISEEQQSRLFRSFEQAESSTSRKFGGTGLGLAISKRIVEMMGGKIWIESEMGKGSTFKFTIQARYTEAEQRDVLNPGINWSSIRALVVDDSQDIREYFAEIMDQFGASCDTAAGGEEACALIERNGPYDLYFVDWKMPGMNGIDLSRHIKESNVDNAVVIMISATEWSTIEEEAKGAGVDKFLSKPLFPSAISDCINECIGVHSQLPSADEDQDVTDCFAGRRIILAEDVEINREIVIALLEPTALTIDCAENGREALWLYNAAPGQFDMIFMDVQMPEMDGYEATRRIRALDFPEARQVPIIAMTANVFREDIEKCLASGMNDHLGKPIDYDEMLEKLRKYLPKKA